MSTCNLETLIDWLKILSGFMLASWDASCLWLKRWPCNLSPCTRKLQPTLEWSLPCWKRSTQFLHRIVFTSEVSRLGCHEGSFGAHINVKFQYPNLVTSSRTICTATDRVKSLNLAVSKTVYRLPRGSLSIFTERLTKHRGLNTPSTGKPQTKPLQHAITYHTRANWFPRQSWLSLYLSLSKNRLPFSIALG